ncbi:MAG: DUF4864 domain-containing protein [Rhodobacteraceae bacterium]|nr:MAG: DUF4864 domain-containing protein [Paracoccaceae bacterium]
MRAILLSLAVMIGLAGAVLAQGKEIEATITAQIEAFKADDFERAFTYASPNIRRLFQTPDNFGRMVRGGYPMVWRPAEVTYLDLAEAGGYLVQRVQIRDAQGALHFLEYQMIEVDGAWRINGVRLLKAPPATA